MVRMPGFGLDGPWRDRTGYAPTMEQLTGLAWITGWDDLPPIVPRGPCDPLAGQHAAFALLVALEERDRTGAGMLLEVPMVESALATATGPIVEAEAYGVVQGREGNRGPVAAPQGVYACAEPERWVAVAVATDEQWRALCDGARSAATSPTDPDLADHAGRRAAGDRLDEALAPWVADRPAADTVEALTAAGVPAAEVISPGAVDRNPQLVERGFFEPIHREVIGIHHVPSLPYRFASRGPAPWHRTPAPLIGEHNDEVLGGELGLGPEELARLRNSTVIGERPLQRVSTGDDWGTNVPLDDVGGKVAIVGVGESEHSRASGRTPTEIAARPSSAPWPTPACAPRTSTGSCSAPACPTSSTPPPSTRTSAPATTCGSRQAGGGMRWAATAPAWPRPRRWPGARRR